MCTLRAITRDQHYFRLFRRGQSETTLFCFVFKLFRPCHLNLVVTGFFFFFFRDHRNNAWRTPCVLLSTLYYVNCYRAQHVGIYIIRIYMYVVIHYCYEKKTIRAPVEFRQGCVLLRPRSHCGPPTTATPPLIRSRVRDYETLRELPPSPPSCDGTTLVRVTRDFRYAVHAQ